MTARWWAGVPGPDLAPDAHLLAAVDSALAGSGAAAELVCTTVDRSAAEPRTGVALRLTAEPADAAATRAALAGALGSPVVTAGSDEGPAPALLALSQASSGLAGRCVRFPGQDGVQGRVTAAELVAGTAIDEVAALGGPVAGDAVIETGGFLRPTWEGGRLRLVVEQAAGGVFQPFEVEFPHLCCGGH
ncbi:hypothetical protein [Modestobacter versicolor]|uniref:Uncharacterized protein n=1 Tax=Modestobacter versicolor TaxID=429133 RepID=A0A839Y2R8_9ACTN|nr:hypothetical protein [Modestobacter versicolor]MBB3677029.1 hypothetical protein [Modestobacter versicolor]